MATDQQEQSLPTISLTLSKYSKRVILKTILNRADKGLGSIGERIMVGGWVKSSKELRKETVRDVALDNDNVGASPNDVTCTEVIQSRIPFFRAILKVFGGDHYQIRSDKLDSIIPKPPPPSISVLKVSDGSCVLSLQIVVDSSLASPNLIMPTGTCILVEGILQQPSVQGTHVELKAEKILHFGMVDQNKYPLSKKRIPLDMLRDSAHFRPRTTTVASVMRIRNALTQATHAFFQENEFLYVQVPLITSTDCEGSSEKFHVTTLLGKEIKRENPITMDDIERFKLEAMRASIMEKSKKVEELKRTDSNKEALVAALQDLSKTNQLALQLEQREKLKSDHSYAKTTKLNFSEDFFSRPTYLTSSGHFHLESYACSLGNVYSFGPRFRPERSESKKFIAEMSMVEVEIAFSQLEDAMNCSDDLLNFLCKWVLEHCSEDLAFISKRVDNTTADRLQLLKSGPFERISYTEAVNVLKQITEKKFDVNVEYGSPLTDQHECYLADEIYKRPVIIYNHPKELKPFYVRLNDDGKTVAAFDMIVPKVGTLIRGSQNEERLHTLNSRIKELKLPKEQFEWYLDLRMHGTAKHSGFTLVFDALVLYATGLNDVRDVIPFPRSCGKAYH